MTKVLMTMSLTEEKLQEFKDVAPGAEIKVVPGREVTEEDVKEAEVILGNVRPNLIAGSKNLRWIQLGSAGTDGYTTPGVLPEGCFLTNATGAYGLAISEHMIGMLLMIQKKLNFYWDNIKNHEWKDGGMVRSIEGANVLVVGLGDIGGDFARKLHAMGAHITGIRRSVFNKPDYIDAIYPMDKLMDCVKDADIVASALPGTPETYHTFTAEVFAAMKEGAIFLNVGRGTAVDQYALADALNFGHLFGAGIDVTDPEPLPADHPLWDAKNILITPHVSGGGHLRETTERIIELSKKNLELYMKGEELQNLVDFKTGYVDHKRYEK